MSKSKHETTDETSLKEARRREAERVRRDNVRIDALSASQVKEEGEAWLR